MDAIGELLGYEDPDKMREFFRKKSKKLENKIMKLSDAVSEFVAENDYMAIGGFGLVRIPTSFLHEVIKQQRKVATCAFFTSNYDTDLVLINGMMKSVDMSYGIALEALGSPKVLRKYFENGGIKVTEWSNGALAWRYKAAAMGLSFLPIRSMLGTDTEKYSAAEEIICPFSGKKYLAVPALYPDIAVIHVHEADMYGNAHIKGVLVADVDIAKASKKVIITAERIVDTEYFRNNPQNTTIPFYLVDAVVEVPYGSYPAEMPYEYLFDIDYFKRFLQAAESDETFDKFIKENIYECKDFYEFISLNGGVGRIKELRNLELGLKGSEL